ncbi:MAG TPA: cytochrome c peroxidase [Thermoanaerobaculia bacterium]|nr:cytochrome c peroxidase [Thermoanaerobaculia bacterium]
MRSRCSALLLAFFVFSCGAKDDASLVELSRSVFGPMPKLAAQPPALVALGKHLYESDELSVNRTQSCNSCHPASGVGADLQPTSAGAHGQRGRRNTPTVLNAAHHLSQFWDGRAATLEEQARGPIVNPVEMAMPDERAVAERLRTSPHIDRALFRNAFPNDADPYTIDHAARAIAAFERTLVTTGRFDRFQTGDRHALTTTEKEGLRLFLSTGCASCHNGPLLGANKFMKLGLIHPYDDNTTDLGRYEVTGQLADRYAFKVPSLRNVALTGPYFHDGSVRELPNAVDRMAWHQLGRKLTPEERGKIVAFLNALSEVKQASR